MPALLPCPFCGSDIVLAHNDNGEWWIACDGCCASIGMESSDCAAADLWNKRANTMEEKFTSTNSAMDAMRELREIMSGEEDAFTKCTIVRQVLAQHE